MATPDRIDKKAFEELFREFFAPLCAFARKYINDDEDQAKDIVHNVFINLWQKKEMLHTVTSLKSYLFTSVHNRCLNYIRDNKKVVRYDLPTEQEEVSNYVSSEDYLEKQELEKKIASAIDALPEKCREVFKLSRFEEKKYGEIAEKLNISVKTVEGQMTKALRMLREQLSDYLFWIVLLIKIFE